MKFLLAFIAGLVGMTVARYLLSMLQWQGFAPDTVSLLCGVVVMLTVGKGVFDKRGRGNR